MDIQTMREIVTRFLLFVFAAFVLFTLIRTFMNETNTTTVLDATNTTVVPTNADLANRDDGIPNNANNNESKGMSNIVGVVGIMVGVVVVAVLGIYYMRAGAHLDRLTLSQQIVRQFGSKKVGRADIMQKIAQEDALRVARASQNLAETGASRLRRAGRRTRQQVRRYVTTAKQRTARGGEVE